MSMVRSSLTAKTGKSSINEDNASNQSLIAAQVMCKYSSSEHWCTMLNGWVFIKKSSRKGCKKNISEIKDRKETTNDQTYPRIGIARFLAASATSW